MPEQATDNAFFDRSAADRKSVGRQEIEDDIIIVTGIERNVIAARFSHGPHDIQRLITIEWRNLDRHNLVNLGKSTPKTERQNAPAHRRLQIESDQRNDFRYLPAMDDKAILIRIR